MFYKCIFYGGNISLFGIGFAMGQPPFPRFTVPRDWTYFSSLISFPAVAFSKS